MPLYEYVCHACQDRFERLARASESSVGVVCPACGGHETKRVFSTFAAAGQRASAPAESGPSCGPVG
jgi:putative FmdB family regulatory protein